MTARRKRSVLDDAAMELSTVPTFTGDVMAAAASH
jgi:hypothetical protein